MLYLAKAGDMPPVADVSEKKLETFSTRDGNIQAHGTTLTFLLACWLIKVPSGC